MPNHRTAHRMLPSIDNAAVIEPWNPAYAPRELDAPAALC